VLSYLNYLNFKNSTEPITQPSIGSSGEVTLTAPTLPAGESAVFNIIVQVDFSTVNQTVIHNTATVSATGVAPISSTIDTSVVPFCPALDSKHKRIGLLFETLRAKYCPQALVTI
jgi:hypothetical protein